MSQRFASRVSNEHHRIFAHRIEAGLQLVVVWRQDVHQFYIIGHVGDAVANDLAFHSVVAVRIVSHVVFHRERIVPIDQRRQFKILGTHFRPRAPTRSIVDPSTPLRIQRIVCTLLHDFPAPLRGVVDFNAVGVVTEFCTVVALPKIMSAGARLQPPHLLIRTRRVGLGQNGLVPIVQVMGALPKRGHVFHIPWRGPLNERKLQIKELLPIAALEFHTVFEQWSIVCHIENPCPAIRTEGQVDAVGRDVTCQFVTVNDLKRRGPIGQDVVVVHRHFARHGMCGQRVSQCSQRAGDRPLRPAVMQICPNHGIPLHFPSCHRHRWNANNLRPPRIGDL